MNNAEIIERYRNEKLIDSKTEIIELIDEDDCDYDNIVGASYFDIPDEHQLFENDHEEYTKMLYGLSNKYSKLFHFVNINKNAIFFECLIGSKKYAHKSYLKKQLLLELETKRCPSCSSSLEIIPLGIIPYTDNDGNAVSCEMYEIRCPNCCGLFGKFGFKINLMLKDLKTSGKRFLSALEHVKVDATGFDVQTRTIEDNKYRCGKI